MAAAEVLSSRRAEDVWTAETVGKILRTAQERGYRGEFEFLGWHPKALEAAIQDRTVDRILRSDDFARVYWIPKLVPHSFTGQIAPSNLEPISQTLA